MNQENNTVETKKNPTTATLLSLLLVGVGQMYNGQVGKGIGMMAGALFGGLFTFGLATLGFWIWSMIDAYQTANKLNQTKHE